MMLFVLLILVLFVSCSLSQPVGISYLYRDSSCLTPYQIEITYGNLCVYSRTNYTSKLITPVLYANIFPINNTVEVYEYASGNYPTVACTGSFKSFIQQFPTTCTLEADILTGNSYYRNIQLLASNPGVANLTHNRPYALVNSYDAINCTGLYKQTIYFMDPCSSITIQGHNYGLKQTCNSTGISYSDFNSTCDSSMMLGQGYDYFAPSSSCMNMKPPSNQFDVDPDSLVLSYSFTCMSVNTASPSTAPTTAITSVGPSTGPSSAPSAGPSLAPSAAFTTGSMGPSAGPSSAPTVVFMTKYSTGPSSAPTSAVTAISEAFNSSSSSSANCFSAQSTLQLLSGDVISMSEASVGQMVLVSSIDGQSTSFKSIVSVPHSKNTVKVTFLEITTVTGKSIQMTPDHLVLGGACTGSKKADVVLASSLTASDCVHTVDGKEAIASITQLVSEGVYTVVTESADDLLVVNGVIASPFSGNHAVANAFYNIVRVANKIFPSFLKYSLLRRTIDLFGNIAVSI